MSVLKCLTWTICLMWMILTQLSSVLSQEALPDRNATSQYPFTVDLDHGGEYVLRWGFNDTMIWFEVQVHTLGYIGFGISESGKMVPADVLVAYVANKKVEFRDYHTVGYTHPVEDVSQDWFVDYGYEDKGWTILGFHRRLDTCDPDGDRVITADTTRIIYSYSYTDPAGLDSLMVHNKRGFKSVSLLTTSPPPQYLPFDSYTKELLNDNYLIPDTEMTTFHCRAFDLSNITKKHHIIKISPVLTKATQHNVDHMILYRCRLRDPSVIFRNGNSFNCFTDAPDHIQFCREHVASFGHGKADFFLPEDVGIPFGGPEESNIYVLATHYENEEYLPNLVDNSGIKITYTSQLRQHDAAFLSLGNIISPNWLQFIPPGDPNFVQKAYCSMRCLAWGIGDCHRRNRGRDQGRGKGRGQGHSSGRDQGRSRGHDQGRSRGHDRPKSVPMTVVGVQFHTHSLGKAMKLRHLTHVSRQRARENPWLAYDKTYDSDEQGFRLLKNRRNVTCWDSLLLECSYDTSKLNRPTVGGWSEYDELCRGYVLYYPRKQIEGCMSWSNYDMLANSQGQKIAGKDVFKTLVSTDWSSDATMKRNLKHALDYSVENGQCWTSSTKRRYTYGIDYFRQPRIQNRYTEQSTSRCL